ncbi:alpha-amylase family glycosyl hydrolase [Kocuria sabuli]|uniref:alpha-amylase family glycosyl hydrolase n=1 Tax=Kocuria sabuli TaxID=3071448 RepID=UPI0034D4DD39
MSTVRFQYYTGLKRALFRNARLSGTFNDWGETPMQEIVGEDGCPAFEAVVEFDDAMAGNELRWGVRLDGPAGANLWGVPTENPPPETGKAERVTIVPSAGGVSTARYCFTVSRFFGAQKFYQHGEERLRFVVWAPNAQAVEVVFGKKDYGYIHDDGRGIDPAQPVVPLHRIGGGSWASEPQGDFASSVGTPYMYRIRTAEGATKYRTDIHSRWQIGRGGVDPAQPGAGQWDGTPATLEGRVSCSVIVDQDMVREEFEPTTDPPRQISDEQFWASEFDPARPVPTRLTELVVYELHIGALGFGGSGPGNLHDAMDFIDHLVKLGVNAVELMPVSETSGNYSWGYGNSHHFVIESSAGGRDKFKHFVRECHRHGIAVIQDVVYNHFDNSAERAQWMYDTDQHERNCYYWYEGRPADHERPEHGYLQNGSSGRTPRLWEENVRQLFTSSAAEFVEEFHIDGFRMDLTSSIHTGHTLDRPHGPAVEAPNVFGHRLLREWSRTLHLVRPTALRTAEDHSGWSEMTAQPDVGGMGFNATWYADFYHDLIGDAPDHGGHARVLHGAGFGTDDPLRLGQFCGSLSRTGQTHVVYHENHDEAGNHKGTLRTICAAVNNQVLHGPTRDYAEARVRVVAGISILSAGTPLFFMGEEIGAQKPYKYDNVKDSREDILGERDGQGARLFRYYQDLIRLRRGSRAIRSRSIDIIHASDENRVIAFVRAEGTTHDLVVASLNNRPFPDGYILRTTADRLPPGGWQEIFNSDAATYGGTDLGNCSATLPSRDGRIDVRLPANGLVVLRRT